jgi:hypothetical protein
MLYYYKLVLSGTLRFISCHRAIANDYSNSEYTIADYS